MRDWGIEITYEPEELSASILKRPSIQSANGAAKPLDDTQILSKIVHQPMALATWAKALLLRSSPALEVAVSGPAFV